MSNMSYCRFENIYKDLLQCQEALDDEEKLSKTETKFKYRLIKICREIASEYSTL